MIGIYKISSPSGKIYIGQAIDIERRKKLYQTHNCPYQIKLLRSLQKYGFANHIFEIIEECLELNLNEHERFWQDYFNVTGINGLNCRLTKTTDKTGVMSEESRIRMRNGQLGRRHKPETISKMRKIAKSYIKTEAHLNNIIEFNRTKLKDISGQKFNMLFALENYKHVKRSTHWQFKCDCGVIKYINVQSVKTEETKSCGCLNNTTTFPNLNDMKFGKLISTGEFFIKDVIWAGRKRKQRMGKFKCECGNIKDIPLSSVLSGHSTTCGCFIRPKRGKYKTE